MFEKFKDDDRIGFFSAYGETHNTNHQTPGRMQGMGHNWGIGEYIKQ